MKINWISRTIITLAFAVSAFAQEAQVKSAPALTELEACSVQVSLLNERIMALQAELTRLQVVLDRQQRTPAPKDGHVWEWALDPKTGQPLGYVKSQKAGTP